MIHLARVPSPLTYLLSAARRRPDQVWDFYLYWGDPALHHFVVLAFVIGNADAILKVIGRAKCWGAARAKPWRRASALRRCCCSRD